MDGIRADSNGGYIEEKAGEENPKFLDSALIKEAVAAIVDASKTAPSLSGRAYQLKEMEINLKSQKSVIQYIKKLRYSEINRFLQNSYNTVGLLKTLPLLEAVAEKNILAGQRFNSINPLSEEREGKYLHIYRNVGKESSNLPIKGMNLADMMEPSFEKILTGGGKSLTVMELLDTDRKDLENNDFPEIFLEYKDAIDSYYKGKVYIELNLENNPMVLTIPTARYMPLQFIAISHPRQHDLLLVKDELRGQKNEKYIEITPKGAKTIHGAQLDRLTKDERKSIIESIKESALVDEIIPNVGNIKSMAEIATLLPKGSFVGQNSMDVSSDKTCQHFQICTNVKKGLIPIFEARGEKIKSSPRLDLYRLDHKEFAGPVYKFTSKYNNRAIRNLLKNIYDKMEKKLGGEITASLVVNKNENENFEYYFILRNKMERKPLLKNRLKELNLSNPGWLEMCGVRIASEGADTFTRVSDEIWKNEILEELTISEENAIKFEFIVNGSF